MKNYSSKARPPNLTANAIHNQVGSTATAALATESAGTRRHKFCGRPEDVCAGIRNDCSSRYVFRIAAGAQQRLNKYGEIATNPAADTTTTNSATGRTTFSHGGSAHTAVRSWNEIANTVSALDHAPVPVGDPRIFGQQLGPGRQSRAMAIVHVAIFDAINAIEGRYRSFTGIPGS